MRKSNRHFKQSILILVFLSVAACFSKAGKYSLDSSLDMLSGCWEPQFAALYFSGGLAEEIYYFNGVCVCFDRKGRYQVMEDGKEIDRGSFDIHGRNLTTRSELYQKPLEKGFTLNQGQILYLTLEKMELAYNIKGQGMGSYTSFKKITETFFSR